MCPPPTAPTDSQQAPPVQSPFKRAAQRIMAPQTVVQPPTPIDGGMSALGFPISSPTPSANAIQEEPLQYDSPDEEDFELPVPSSSTLRRPVPQPSRSNPLPTQPRSIAMMPGTSESGIVQSPMAASPSSLPSVSPIVQQLARVPSPSSPDYLLRHKHHRASSTHRVRETTLAEFHHGADGARMVNQYRIADKLGQGAYATVYRAVDVSTGKEYAVKEFSKGRLQHQWLQEKNIKQTRERRMMSRRRPPPTASSDVDRPVRKPLSRGNSIDEMTVNADPLAFIRREIAVMKKLDHPNVVKLYEAISVSNADALFLVLEYCSGGALPNPKLGADNITAKNPVEERQAREYLRQICLGLEYLHCNGVAHRDIKPDNILITADGRSCKLADFGVSEMFSTKGDDTIRTVGGSPAFLAPESFNASWGEVHSKPVDIWALGVTLYCMLTGTLPWNNPIPIELMEEVKSKEVEIPSTWHPDLQALVKGMLTKDPNLRMTMEQIRENPWLIEWGAQPMVSVEDNLYTVGKEVLEPTNEELSKAFTAFRSIFTVVRAVNKMRKSVAVRKLSTQSAGPATPSDLSVTSGSMDSYHLPDAVTTGPTTPAGLSDSSSGRNVNLFESPESSMLYPAGSEPFEVKTGGQEPTISAEPDTMDSPEQYDSPAPMDSPTDIDMPTSLAGLAVQSPSTSPNPASSSFRRRPRPKINTNISVGTSSTLSTVVGSPSMDGETLVTSPIDVEDQQLVASPVGDDEPGGLPEQRFVASPIMEEPDESHADEVPIFDSPVDDDIPLPPTGSTYRMPSTHRPI